VNNSDGTAPRVAILALESGRVLADWRSQVGNTNLAWSADGQLLAVGSYSGDSRIYVWNVRLRKLASVFQGHTLYIINARFSHAGHLLATASGDGTTRLWDAPSGECLATVTGSALDFAPDDRRLAFGLGASIGVCEFASGDEFRTLHPAMLGNRSEKRDAVGVLSGAFSNDGRLLATSDEDGVRLWEADTGREIAHLMHGGCADALFHPDGKSLVICGMSGLHRWPISPDPEHGPTRSGSDHPNSSEISQGTTGAGQPGWPIIGRWRLPTTLKHGSFSSIRAIPTRPGAGRSSWTAGRIEA
jgi:WD40 repeat protein